MVSHMAAPRSGMRVNFAESWRRTQNGDLDAFTELVRCYQAHAIAPTYARARLPHMGAWATPHPDGPSASSSFCAVRNEKVLRADYARRNCLRDVLQAASSCAGRRSSVRLTHRLALSQR